MEEVLGLIIATDLRYAMVYVDALSKKDKMEAAGSGELPAISKPKDKTKKHVIAQNLDDAFIVSNSEYWEYLLSDSSLDERKYGLLYFTHFILKSFKQRDIDGQSSDFTNIKMEIRDHLMAIVKSMKEIDSSSSDSRYNDLKMMICECLEILPFENVLKAGKNISIQGNPHEKAVPVPVTDENKGAGDIAEKVTLQNDVTEPIGLSDRLGSQELKKKCTDQFVAHLRKYLVNRRISYETLFNLLVLTNSTDFTKNAKHILGIEDDDKALDLLVAFQVRDQRGDIDPADSDELMKEKTTLVDFARLLILLEEVLSQYQPTSNKVFLTPILKNQVDEKYKNNRMNHTVFKTSDSLRASYQRFITDYVRIFLEDGGYDREMKHWVKSVLKKLVTKRGNYDESLAFLRALQKVFIKSNEKLFLLRTLRLILERVYNEFKKTDKLSGSKDDSDTSLDHFGTIQNLFDEAEVPIFCLSVINENNDNLVIDEACNILCLLLLEGNCKVQESVFKTFEENIFTLGFFTYLTDRLERGLDTIRYELAYPLERRSILEMEEKLIVQRFKNLSSQEMIITLLHVLKYFCDNCFVKFQDFLRIQKTGTLKFNLHSVNMLEKISFFLVKITKEMPGDMIFGKLSKLVEVILNVLTEFVIGPCVENQRLMIQNRKFLDVVNTIFKIKSEDRNEKDTKIASIKIIHQTAVFLESLVTGNEDTKLLGLLLDSLSKKHLKDQLLKIYILKVQTNRRLLFLDKYCRLVDNDEEEGRSTESAYQDVYTVNCTQDYCREKKISYFDLMMVNTAFKIFLIIKQLEDKMPNTPALESLGYQELVNKPIFEEIRKKHSIMDLREFTTKENSLKNLNLNKIVNLKKNTEDKGRQKYLDADQGLEAELEDTEQEAESEQTQEVELMPDMQALKHVDDKDKTAVTDLAKVIGEMANQTKGAEDASMLNEFFKYEKKRFYNHARQFFSSYVASLEINYEGKMEKVHFQIPYCCKFISKSIKRNLIREVNRNSDQERLESFFFKAKHYEYEMRRRQNLSQWTVLYFFVKHWKAIKYINFGLIVAINTMMVIYFQHDYQQAAIPEDSYSVTTANSMDGRSPQVSFSSITAEVIFKAMTYVQVVMAAIVLMFCAYENYPKILYNTSKDDNFLREREKIKNTKFNDKLQAKVEKSESARETRYKSRMTKMSMFYSNIIDFNNIYNLCLFIVSIISMLNYPLLYALLLFDLVKLSRTLSSIFMALVVSSKLLGLTMLLTLIVLFVYSVIGFNYFPRDYLHEVRVCYTGGTSLQELLPHASRLLRQHGQQRTEGSGRHRRGTGISLQR